MIGYFNEKGNEYTITKYELKRPMFNYMWNSKILSAVNHFGGGTDAYANMTSAYIGEAGKERAQLIANGNRYFFVKDLSTGKVWNPGWYPVREELDEYSCTNGLGYTKITGEKDGISVELTASVSKDEPAEIWKVTVLNNSEDKRIIDIYPFMEFSLEGFASNTDYNCWVKASYHNDEKMIYVKNSDHQRPHDYYNGFIAVNREILSYDTSKNKFFGRYGNVSCPDAIKKDKLNNSNASCERMVGALQCRAELSAGEKIEFCVTLGSACSEDDAKRAVKKILCEKNLKEHFNALYEEKELFDFCKINTPDKKINDFTNYWLKQQVQLCAEVGRGAGKGFRDQLQDSWGIAAFNGELAKKKIYETLQQIYHSGRCIRGWLPLKDRNMSDGPTWVAPTVNAYLKETGDYNFLWEKVSYLDGGEDTVWEHILTTTRYCANDLGEHGLVKAHDGDWNDSLSGMGKDGKGESVWSTIALYNALINVAEIAKKILKNDEIHKEMLDYAEKMKKAVNENGWDGDRYLAGYTDSGEKVGSSENKEGAIYLNSQIWAVMTGIADEERTKVCMASVEKYLETKYGALTLYPPYTSYRPEIGRLTGFAAGIWENGTPYCHGCSFKAIADCTIGDGDDAYETIKKIMPDNENNPSEHSGAEPYALTNMYYGPANKREGETSFSWITGTAGWVYRAITEYIMGFHPEYDGITVDPCVPKGWKNVSMTRRFRGDIYRLEIVNDNNKSKGIGKLYVDGIETENKKIKLFSDGKEHHIKVILED